MDDHVGDGSARDDSGQLAMDGAVLSLIQRELYTGDLQKGRWKVMLTM